MMKPAEFSIFLCRRFFNGLPRFQVDFYIDKNMIHIADTKVDRRYGDFFIRQIHKCEELNRSLVAIKM